MTGKGRRLWRWGVGVRVRDGVIVASSGAVSGEGKDEEEGGHVVVGGEGSGGFFAFMKTNTGKCRQRVQPFSPEQSPHHFGPRARGRRSPRGPRGNSPTSVWQEGLGREKNDAARLRRNAARRAAGGGGRGGIGEWCGGNTLIQGYCNWLLDNVNFSKVLSSFNMYLAEGGGRGSGSNRGGG